MLAKFEMKNRQSAVEGGQSLSYETKLLSLKNQM